MSDWISDWKRVLAASCLAVVLGCQTPYAPYDCTPTNNPWPFSGWSCKGGYSEIEIAPLTYTVRFEGMHNTRPQAEDYALLRAAELTLEKGYRHFVVIQASDATMTLTTSTPSTYTPPTTTCDKKGKCTTYGGSWTGGGTSTTVLPAYALTIRLIDEPDDQSVIAYDAELIQRSVRGKHGFAIGSAGVPARDRPFTSFPCETGMP
jgi:hypothetical protein